ncbi:MAG: hypothetical protein JWO74_4891, partial [Solirubrobacterales bacterium]|nr:hypothetical protein [Solirubrobacterales bacterium]
MSDSIAGVRQPTSGDIGAWHWEAPTLKEEKV